MFDTFTRRKYWLEKIPEIRKKPPMLDCNRGEPVLEFSDHTVIVDMFLEEDQAARFERSGRRLSVYARQKDSAEDYAVRRNFTYLRGKFNFGHGPTIVSFKAPNSDREIQREVLNCAALPDEILEDESTTFTRQQLIDSSCNFSGVQVKFK